MTDDQNNTLAVATALIPISLTFAPSSSKQHYLEMQVEQGTTIFQALQRSGWFDEYPELADWCQQSIQVEEPDKKQWYVGVFSFKQPLDYILQAHDRIEIYRPLTQDPMRKRKARARHESK